MWCLGEICTQSRNQLHLIKGFSSLTASSLLGPQLVHCDGPEFSAALALRRLGSCSRGVGMSRFTTSQWFEGKRRCWKRGDFLSPDLWFQIRTSL
ncbi:hypothetical protein MHYP_G00087110 [Metynnis hypsauchen]